MAPAVVVGPAVWGLSPDTPGTGLGAADLRHEARRHRRPAGRRQRRRPRRGARRARGRGRHGAHRRAGRRRPLRGRAGAGRRAGRRHRGRGARSWSRPAILAPPSCSWLRHPPASATPLDRPVAVGAQPTTATRARSTPSSPTLPTYRAARPDPPRPPRLRPPPRHRHRRPAARRDGGRPPADGRRPGGGAADVLRQRPVGPRPQPAGRRAPRVQPRDALHALPAPGRLDRRAAEPQRWLEVYGDRVQPGLPRRRRTLAGDDAGRLRAGLLHAQGVRHELRRRAARRAAGQGPRADPLRDAGEGASTSPARPPSRAPACGGRAAATRRGSSSPR